MLYVNIQFHDLYVNKHALMTAIYLYWGMLFERHYAYPCFHMKIIYLAPVLHELFSLDSFQEKSSCKQKGLCAGQVFRWGGSWQGGPASRSWLWWCGWLSSWTLPLSPPEMTLSSCEWERFCFKFFSFLPLMLWEKVHNYIYLYIFHYTCIFNIY